MPRRVLPAAKYRVVQSALKTVKIIEECDQYNLPSMRERIARQVSAFLRQNIRGSWSVQKTENGLTKCIAIVSITYPK
jgi:hypothetical protein